MNRQKMRLNSRDNINCTDYNDNSAFNFGWSND